MRTILFSRVFPAYHPRKCEETFFVEKIYNSIYEKEGDWSNAIDPDGKNTSYVIPLNHFIHDKKHHTIRAGSHWNVADKFSPRVWSGKPYRSKQITIAPDIEIKKIWDFEIRDSKVLLNGWKIDDNILSAIAVNDGLTIKEMKQWFKYPKDFSGQLLCWNSEIEYDTNSIISDNEMLFHECPQCNIRCNCSDQPCSCCVGCSEPVEDFHCSECNGIDGHRQTCSEFIR